LRNLRDAGSKSDAKVMRTASAGVVRETLERAVGGRVASVIRDMAREKFKASGLKNRSGELEKAMNNLMVRLRWKGSKPYIQVMIKDAPEKVIRYAAAHNYGAVRQPKIKRFVPDLPSMNRGAGVRKTGVIGDRAKRTLKQQVLGQRGISKRAKAWSRGKQGMARKHKVLYDASRSLRTGKSFRVAVVARSTGAIGNDVYEDKVAGSFVIIPGRGFFTFTREEKQRIATMVEQAVMREMSRKG